MSTLTNSFSGIFYFVLLIVIIFSGIMLGCSQGYEVEFQNHHSFPVLIEIRQYNTGFGGTQGPKFPEKHLLRSDTVLVEPGAKISLKYSDACGGLWILWAADSPENQKFNCFGEIDFTSGKSPFVVSLDIELCSSKEK